MKGERIPDVYYPDNGFEDLVEIDPVHRIQNATGTYEQEYNYSAIHFDGLDLPTEISNRKYFSGDGGVWSTYKNKPPILLTEHGLYVHESAERKGAENQAYFALSILAGEGLVSNFTKR